MNTNPTVHDKLKVISNNWEVDIKKLIIQAFKDGQVAMLDALKKEGKLK